MTELLDEIWEGDLLERKEEAQLFINYIKSVSQRPNVREDVSSFTISVDAGYGEGKTYFLKRVAAQMKLNHPVAFVDAWRDDLADEPLTALVVTLQDALGDLIESNPKIEKKWETIKSKGGSIAKIVGKGVATKVASKVIGRAGVEALVELQNDATDDDKKEVKEAVDTTLNNMAEALGVKEPAKLMQSRIEDFKAGREAIDDFKKSLSGLIDLLRKDGPDASIVIIIDELDRCRPTYAVKLLEEIKHLFDVEGLVFVFGINGEQLGHSLAGAYGNEFDGQAYLSRFINREYRLKLPSKVNFVRNLMELYRIPSEKLFFPKISQETNEKYRTMSDKITFYLDRYEISIRDTVKVMQIIETCCALTSTFNLNISLLLPLILSKVNGGKAGEILVALNKKEKFVYRLYDGSGAAKLFYWDDLAVELNNYCNLTNQELINLHDNKGDVILTTFRDFLISRPYIDRNIFQYKNYPELINTVGRYSSLKP